MKHAVTVLFAFVALSILPGCLVPVPHHFPGPAVIFAPGHVHSGSCGHGHSGHRYRKSYRHRRAPVRHVYATD